MSEIEDLRAEIAELTRALDESPAGAREEEIAVTLHHLNERLKALLAKRS